MIEIETNQSTGYKGISNTSYGTIQGNNGLIISSGAITTGTANLTVKAATYGSLEAALSQYESLLILLATQSNKLSAIANKLDYNNSNKKSEGGSSAKAESKQSLIDKICSLNNRLTFLHSEISESVKDITNVTGE